MKFISKSSNLHIILRPGIQAQPMVGAPAKPAISVRFQNGLANVENEELVTQMLAHPGFESDFISADEISADPYSSFRQDSEPAHVVTEMKYGTPQKTFTSKTKPQLPPEVLKLIQEQATEIAKQMLPSMVEATLKTIVGAKEAAKTATPVEVPEPIKMETETPDEYTDEGELIEDYTPEEVESSPVKAETRKGGKPAQPKK